MSELKTEIRCSLCKKLLTTIITYKDGPKCIVLAKCPCGGESTPITVRGKFILEKSNGFELINSESINVKGVEKFILTFEGKNG
ncbi:MAG: hypothetical protein WC967_12065 [Balneolaceae bacterium]